MGLVNEYRLNELGQFVEISVKKATEEYRQFLTQLIFSKFNNSKNASDFGIYSLGETDIEEAEIPLLYQIALSVGVGQDTIDYVPYKFHIAVTGDKDATFDFRDMEMMNSKSESMMMSLLIKELGIPPIEPTLIRFKRTNPAHYQQSYLVLCNDRQRGSFCRYYSVSHPNYHTVLKQFN
jgi:hypothetical protein